MISVRWPAAADRTAVEAAIAKLKTPEFKSPKDKAGVESVGDPFSDQTFSDDGRIAYLRLTEEGERRLAQSFTSNERERQALREAFSHLEASVLAD